MSTAVVSTRAHAEQIALELKSDFLSGLKDQQVPDADEVAVVTRATRTLAAAQFLGTGHPEVQEAVAKAKGMLINVGLAHAIDAEELYKAVVMKAIQKYTALAVSLLLAAG